MTDRYNANYPGRTPMPEHIDGADLQAAHDELDWLINALTQIAGTVKVQYGHLEKDDLELIAERLVEGAYNSININRLRDDDVAELAGLSRWQRMAEKAFIEAFHNTETS